MSKYGFVQQIDEPTHQDGHTLDHLYLNEFQVHLSRPKVKAERFGLVTDHYPVFFQIPSVRSDDQMEIRRFRKYGNINVVSFKTDLAEAYKDTFRKSEDECDI